MTGSRQKCTYQFRGSSDIIGSRAIFNQMGFYTFFRNKMQDAGCIHRRQSPSRMLERRFSKISGIRSCHIGTSSMDYKYQAYNLTERSSDGSGFEDFSKDYSPHRGISASQWIWSQVFPWYFHRHWGSGQRCDGQRIYNNIWRRLQSESRSRISKISNGRILHSILNGYCKTRD